MSADFQMSGARWPIVALGDIAKIIGGRPAPQDQRAFAEDGIPFVRMRDLGRYHLTSNLREVDSFIDPKYARDHNLEPLKAGAILMPRSGSVALNHRAILGRDAIIVSHICAIQPNEEKVFNRYLYRYLCTQRLDSITKKTTGLDAINLADLRRLMVPLPTLSAQRRIAEILEEADVIQRKREDAIQLANEFIRSVFLDMFGDPATNAKGLRKLPLGSFGKIVTGNTPPRADPDNFGDAIEWIKSDNVNTAAHFLTRADEGLSVKGKALGRVVPKGSILITCIAGSASSIGRAAIADRDVSFNQQINAIVPNKDINLYFLYAQFLIGKPLVLKSSTNSMKLMISKGAFQKIEFLCPDTKHQDRFGEIFERQMEVESALKDASIRAADLYAALSQRAFRGEL